MRNNKNHGLPDDEWGEAVTANAARQNKEAVSAAEIFEFADELLDYKRPKHVEFVDEIPKTPYGKMDKKVLRDEYWKKEE